MDKRKASDALSILSYVLIVMAVILFVVSTYNIVETIILTMTSEENAVTVQLMEDNSMVVRASIVGGGIVGTEVSIKLDFLDPSGNILLTAENSTTVSPGSKKALVLRLTNLPKEAQTMNLKLGFKTLKSMEIDMISRIRGD